MKSRNYSILAIVILCFAGILVYADTFSSPFCFDDYFSILANQAIRSPVHLKDIWDFWPTRFLTYYSLALNYRCGMLDVSGYHFVNLTAHIISGILVWWLTLMILSAVQPDSGREWRVKVLALFSGLLFLIHPVQTQAVTYIIQRTTSLAALFYLAALCFYAKARILLHTNEERFKGKVFYFSALASCIMAMFTKEMSITLPLAVVLYEFCFFGKEKFTDKKIVFPFLLTLFIMPLTMSATRSVNILGMHRAIEPAADVSPLSYLLTEFRVIVTYLRLIFVPLNQNLDYDYSISRSLIEFNVLASLFVLVIIFASAIILLRKHRLISFSIFWFFLTLLPESSIIPIKDVIFEHRLYLPMFGYSLFAVSVIYYFCGRKSIKVAFVALGIIAISYASLAYKRNSVWQDEVLLWNDTITKSPGKSRPYNERGFVYLLKGSYNHAIADFTKALEIDPKYVSAYNNRGIAYIRKGDYGKALFDFTEAINMEVKYASAYSNRAVAYFYRHEYERAWEDVNKATALGAAIDPRFLEDLKNTSGRER